VDSRWLSTDPCGRAAARRAGHRDTFGPAQRHQHNVEAEMRATSALLSVLTVVRDFSSAVLCPLGASTAKICPQCRSKPDELNRPRNQPVRRRRGCPARPSETETPRPLGLRAARASPGYGGSQAEDRVGGDVEKARVCGAVLEEADGLVAERGERRVGAEEARPGDRPRRVGKTVVEPEADQEPERRGTGDVDGQGVQRPPAPLRQMTATSRR
jgi:hypothetical protein